jgi:hypothetical protein
MRGSAVCALLALAACGKSSPPLLGDVLVPDGSTGDDGSPGSFGVSIPASDDPKTCAEAAMSRSYVGCDYWPTVVANNVWSIFDYAVVVANAGSSTASVTITGPNGTSQTQTIAPNALGKFYLPWVPVLKGPDTDSCGSAIPIVSSVVAPAAAYHLVSSVPVIVSQFNALEYVGKGGPAGKDWSTCPGSQPCSDQNSSNYGATIGCYSFSNDSSLLLPSSALTGNYRITAFAGETAPGPTGQPLPYMSSYVAITATVDATHVRVLVSAGGDVLAGTGVTATPGGGELDLTLDAGDVAELTSDLGDKFDLGGTLVAADQPVQVIAGAPCDQVPETTPACDHLEQSVFPAETLGTRYFVTVPTGPEGVPIGHVVRLIGNVDGTTLTYKPARPSGCPTTLAAGQATDCGIVSSDFEVTGSHEFAVASFMLGGSLVDPSSGLGDPSQTVFAAVEQYRVKYVFLAPDDYTISLIDVVAPTGTELVLDGSKVTSGLMSPIADGYETWRIALSATNGGAHTLLSSKPVGIQVIGYGQYTSYQYPAGLNLLEIAPPPVTQ